jgi:replicative DNA helicase
MYRYTKFGRVSKNNLVANYLKQFMKDIQDNKNRKLISTGFLKLNAKLGDGLIPGLHVIGAIPSLGKTTFALQIADYIAKNGTDVLFFSLEMRIPYRIWCNGT